VLATLRDRCRTDDKMEKTVADRRLAPRNHENKGDQRNDASDDTSEDHNIYPAQRPSFRHAILVVVLAQDASPSEAIAQETMRLPANRWQLN